MEWLFLFVVVVIAAILVLKAKLLAKENSGDSAAVEEPYTLSAGYLLASQLARTNVVCAAIAGYGLLTIMSAKTRSYGRPNLGMERLTRSFPSIPSMLFNVNCTCEYIGR